VQVLEAREIAPGDDQVHPLRVLDVEVANGPAALVDDAEADLLGAAAGEVGVVDDDTQPVVGDREPAHGVRAAAAGWRRVPAAGLGVAVVAAGLGVGLLVRGRARVLGLRLAAARIGIDDLAGDQAGAEQQRQHAGERQELSGDRAHAVTS